MSGWNGSDRKSRLPGNWATLRKKRLEIDGGRCTWRLPSGKRCPRAATDVDHKIEGSDDDRISELRSLCEAHHLKKTARAAAQIKAAKKASRYRKPEEHPSRVR